MIYFDNSATGGFKPNSALSAAENTMRYLSANPGRSAHRLSLTGARIIYDCRKLLSSHYNATPERVIFTKNCTEALNLAILGSAKKGGHVITTVYEHNSVLRPLYYLEKQGIISLTIVEEKPRNILSAIKNAVNDNTYLVAVTAVSNVTGEKLPINAIGAFCHKNNLLFLCDGAQAGGHISLDVKKDNLSLLTLAGHKGLCSIMGVGVLIMAENVDISPITFGGTGTDTFNKSQPEFYPEKLECGTLNLPAIASLFEGARYAFNNEELFGRTLISYSEKIIDGISSIHGVQCFSQPNECGIVSFLHENISSSEFADLLNKNYDIAVRGGFHCAPLIHKRLHTDKDGLVRISCAPQNSGRELNTLVSAIREISKSF